MRPTDDAGSGGFARCADRLDRFLAGLDRGEIVSGRVLQAAESEAVRITIGAGAFWARAMGGTPDVGPQRFEVVVPGQRPILRVMRSSARDEINLLVDPSFEKACPQMGLRLDRKA
ncbi:MAG: hypothetical protein KAY24_12000 [Candidatus Eisenbacteria sp.]|nr:hypothetical protein [Candidatus Eisenbacteria bacterium]